jgi:glucose-6-phosphate 1-epimerase
MVKMLPEGIRLDDTPGGLPKLSVHTAHADAELYLHGAHVTRWQPRGHAHPVLWMSAKSWFEPRRPIRGGVPICFPWFGPHPGRSDAPAHGIARVQSWDLVDAHLEPDGNLVVSLGLASNDRSDAFGIGPFTARYDVRIGRTLELTLRVTNAGAAPFRFEEALHTYLAVSEATRVRVSGLLGAEYYDKTDGLRRKREDAPAVAFTAETDRLYVDTTATVAVDDPGWQRRISIAKSGSNATVVWNPWVAKSAAMPDFGDEEWQGMACVETANAVDNLVELSPGATHAMTAVVSVEPHGA